MADSNTTKKALASALKELMEEHPFEKINVSDICERCEMKRKSFYYHFKDKHDLVNWIFDTEFVATEPKETDRNIWKLVNLLCEYFYKNRSFYRKAFSIQGQNSFSEHFRDFLIPKITNRLAGVLTMEELESFQSKFIAEISVLAFQKWLIDSKMSPEEFINQMKLGVKYIVNRYERDA